MDNLPNDTLIYEIVTHLSTLPDILTFTLINKRMQTLASTYIRTIHLTPHKKITACAVINVLSKRYRRLESIKGYIQVMTSSDLYNFTRLTHIKDALFFIDSHVPQVGVLLSEFLSQYVKERCIGSSFKFYIRRCSRSGREEITQLEISDNQLIVINPHGLLHDIRDKDIYRMDTLIVSEFSVDSLHIPNFSFIKTLQLHVSPLLTLRKEFWSSITQFIPHLSILHIQPRRPIVSKLFRELEYALQDLEWPVSTQLEVLDLPLPYTLVNNCIKSYPNLKSVTLYASLSSCSSDIVRTVNRLTHELKLKVILYIWNIQYLYLSSLSISPLVQFKSYSRYCY